MDASFRTAILYVAVELPNLEVILETVRSVLAEQLPNTGFVPASVIQGGAYTLEQTMIRLADDDHVSVIVTVGGIGPTGYVSDATQAVCHKLFPGFGTILRQTALRTNSVATLWRNTAGLRHQTLIVNLPGSVEVIQEGLPLLFPAIPNAIRLAGEKINYGVSSDRPLSS